MTQSVKMDLVQDAHHAVRVTTETLVVVEETAAEAVMEAAAEAVMEAAADAHHLAAEAAEAEAGSRLKHIIIDAF
jgi:hypothetical protein